MGICRLRRFNLRPIYGFHTAEACGSPRRPARAEAPCGGRGERSARWESACHGLHVERRAGKARPRLDGRPERGGPSATGGRGKGGPANQWEGGRVKPYRSTVSASGTPTNIPLGSLQSARRF